MEVLRTGPGTGSGRAIQLIAGGIRNRSNSSVDYTGAIANDGCAGCCNNSRSHRRRRNGQTVALAIRTIHTVSWHRGAFYRNGVSARSGCNQQHLLDWISDVSNAANGGICRRTSAADDVTFISISAVSDF